MICPHPSTARPALDAPDTLDRSPGSDHAVTSGTRDTQAVLNLVWEILLPAMQDAPLRADEESRQKLAKTLAGLSLRPLNDIGSSRANQDRAGKTYHFPPTTRSWKQSCCNAPRRTTPSI